MRYALAVLLLASPAHADYIPAMAAATDLGSVLAAEQGCGLSLSRQAVEAYIEAKVDPAEMQFAMWLDMMTKGTEVQLRTMPPLRLAAFCKATSRSAEHFGLLAD